MALPNTGQVAISLFIFFVGLGIGGGLYETLVVYPNWKTDPMPDGLPQKLRESGQARAGRRFWPFVSPVSALLAICNAAIAWNQTGPVRTLWLAASIAIIVKSIATYGYFVPTMVRRIGRAEGMDAATLQSTVRIWTTLSPLRILVEIFAWVVGLKVLTILSRG
jgi:hypothetical protein